MVISSLFSVHNTNIKRQFYWPTVEKDSLPRVEKENYLLCQFYWSCSLAQGPENLAEEKENFWQYEFDISDTRSQRSTQWDLHSQGIKRYLN